MINTEIMTFTISHVVGGLFRHVNPGKIVLQGFFSLQHLPDMPQIITFFTGLNMGCRKTCNSKRGFLTVWKPEHKISSMYCTISND